jgi:hypothetical protein
MASTLNADLRRADAISLIDTQSITAWLAIRNNAAHGHYNNYEVGQVALMIDGIRHFVQRHPA